MTPHTRLQITAWPALNSAGLPWDVLLADWPADHFRPPRASRGTRRFARLETRRAIAISEIGDPSRTGVRELPQLSRRLDAERRAGRGVITGRTSPTASRSRRCADHAAPAVRHPITARCSASPCAPDTARRG